MIQGWFKLIRSDGQVFHFNDHSRVITQTNGLGLAKYDHEVVAGYRSDASQVLASYLQPRDITLTFIDLSKKNIEARRQRLTEFLRPNRDSPLILRYISPQNLQREIEVYANNPIDYPLGQSGITLGLKAYDPRFRNPIQQSVLVDDTPSGGFGFPFGFPFGFSQVVAEEAITYNGNISEYPTFVITGPFSTFKINHVEKDVDINITSGIALGETLTIDLNPTNLSIYDGNGTNQINKMSTSNLAVWTLDPDSTSTPSGVNTVTYEATGFDGNTTLTVQYYERYASL